ncbi:hypothetical protein C8Q76DRAFT_804304 [Earliella scabrosa]|nr:hypothetical protein C8Q76DRAFT_804304 [Earliella scabrosa]
MSSFPIFHDSDLVLRSAASESQPCGEHNSIDFHVHRCIMSAASPFFEAMLSLPQPSAEHTSNNPIIPFTESAPVLETLLRYVYPIPDPHIATLDELVPALEAARKYDMTAATEGLRRRLVAPDFLKASPLRVYAIASRFELDKEAALASTATLAVGLHTLPLHDDLQSMSGYAYHKLLLLHQRRTEAAIALLERPSEVSCMLCSGRRGALDEPPRWWERYRAAAAEELRARPTSAVVCSLAFLQQAARVAGCERCAGSILASFWFFEDLRCKIDELPATV